MTQDPSATPRYITGRVMPIGKDRQPETRMEPLFPADVRRVSVSLDIPDYTKEGVEGAITRFPACVDELIAQGAPAEVTRNTQVIEAYLGHGAAARLKSVGDPA